MKSSSYGKKVDIWATGMIMHELLTKGGHPLLGLDFYNKLDMPVEEFKSKMTTLIKSEKIVEKTSTFTDFAFKLMENMLSVNPNPRYSCKRALKHPWITRNFESKIPMNMFEEMQLNMKAYEKLKFATRVAYAMTMINHKVLKRDLVKNYEINKPISKKQISDQEIRIENLSSDNDSNKSDDLSDLGKSPTAKKFKLIFNGIPVPKTSAVVEKREKAVNSTTIKKKSFRIKRNKAVKKRLFSANARDDTENEPSNRAPQSFKHSQHLGIREKGMYQQLPPLSHYLNSQSHIHHDNGYGVPIKGDHLFKDHSVPSTNMKKNRSLVK